MQFLFRFGLQTPCRYLWILSWLLNDGPSKRNVLDWTADWLDARGGVCVRTSEEEFQNGPSPSLLIWSSGTHVVPELRLEWISISVVLYRLWKTRVDTPTETFSWTLKLILRTALGREKKRFLLKWLNLNYSAHHFHQKLRSKDSTPQHFTVTFSNN